MRSVFFVAFICASYPCLACSFDIDCSVGSRCLKTPGSLYGVCAGGLSPGNSNDQRPVYDPLDLNHSTGNTCSFDLNCGINATCVKDRSSISGVCMPAGNPDED